MFVTLQSKHYKLSTQGNEKKSFLDVKFEISILRIRKPGLKLQISVNLIFNSNLKRSRSSRNF
jgi:hypothetical protein